MPRDRWPDANEGVPDAAPVRDVRPGPDVRAGLSDPFPHGGRKALGSAKADDMRGNLRSSLRGRRRNRDPMAAYDRLPPRLRRWLSEAVLPWSAESALAIWRRALAESGCEDDALARCAAAERAMLARDAPRVWKPAAAAPKGVDRPGRGGATCWEEAAPPGCTPRLRG